MTEVHQLTLGVQLADLDAHKESANWLARPYKCFKT